MIRGNVVMMRRLGWIVVLMSGGSGVVGSGKVAGERGDNNEYGVMSRDKVVVGELTLGKESLGKTG